jgi:glutamate---cysteine ligase / carboxylate-amine ligase
VPVADRVLRAAQRDAAHEGLEGTLLDLRTLAPRPAWALLDDLVTAVGPALNRHGDLGFVRDGLARARLTVDG